MHWLEERRTPRGVRQLPFVVPHAAGVVAGEVWAHGGAPRVEVDAREHRVSCGHDTVAGEVTDRRSFQGAPDPCLRRPPALDGFAIRDHATKSAYLIPRGG